MESQSVVFAYDFPICFVWFFSFFIAKVVTGKRVSGYEIHPDHEGVKVKCSFLRFGRSSLILHGSFLAFRSRVVLIHCSEETCCFQILQTSIEPIRAPLMLTLLLLLDKHTQRKPSFLTAQLQAHLNQLHKKRWVTFLKIPARYDFTCHVFKWIGSLTVKPFTLRVRAWLWTQIRAVWTYLSRPRFFVKHHGWRNW